MLGCGPAQFMEYIARHHVMNDAPPVFIAYLDVLKALAAGPQGAQVGLGLHPHVVCL